MAYRRHTRNLEATKEIFWSIDVADTGTNNGAFGGGLVESDQDDVWIDGYLPWDFASLKELAVVFIPQATLTPMTFRIITNYAKAGIGYNDAGETLDKQVNTIGNRITEVSIADCFDTKLLSANEYLGVNFTRVAGQNTNALVLGLRMRYNTPIYAHAP